MERRDKLVDYELEYVIDSTEVRREVSLDALKKNN